VIQRYKSQRCTFSLLAADFKNKNERIKHLTYKLPRGGEARAHGECCGGAEASCLRCTSLYGFFNSSHINIPVLISVVNHLHPMRRVRRWLLMVILHHISNPHVDQRQSVIALVMQHGKQDTQGYANIYIVT
jgi:hypothetical protein